MSAAVASTKKTMAVSADQFEDAEEETEDFLGGAATNTPKGDDTAASVPDVKQEEAPPSTVSSKTEDNERRWEENETTRSPKEASNGTEDGPGKDTSKAALPQQLPSKSGTNPLDALASACVVKEQLKVAEPKLTAGSTKVRAEAISCTDVLCGRGGQSNHHPGNIFFRRLVRAKQEEYLKANKREKTIVAKDIVKLIRMLSPPGRFLKKDSRDENVYVDVGDNMARNKASQALREGAPELREELRDQHSRLNAERGGGPEVKLPYHGNNKSSSNTEARAEVERAAVIRKEREELAALALARGSMISSYGAAAAGLRGQTDPPDGSEDEADATNKGVSAAAVQSAAEERARRLMLASGGAPPGLGAHFLSPHLGLGGLGAASTLNPFLAGHSAAHLAALQAAGGGHLFSQQALMMASQPSAAALLQASRAREFAHYEAANIAAATGINPLLLGAQRAAQAPFQDSMRLHELMAAKSNASKREREEIERELDESYVKAAKLSRPYI